MQLNRTWWAFIRVLLLLLSSHLSMQTDSEQVQDTSTTDDTLTLSRKLAEEAGIHTDTVADGKKPSTSAETLENNGTRSTTTDTPVVQVAEKITEYQRPSCEKGRGCNKPLECFDFSSLGKDSPVPDPPHAVEVTPIELEDILENKLYENCCAIVMFYAPWCEFSVQFARRFNAIGRTFSELPVLAVDLGENEPHKYILAYLPVVVFYHRAKVIYKFDLTESYEELSFQIANMTDFVAIEVDMEDEENEYPVPTQRSNGDWLVLQLALWWLVFVTVVLVIRSRPVADCVQRIKQRLIRTKVD